MTDSSADQSKTSRPQIVSGPLRSTILLLALPVLLEQLLSFCVGFYDTFLSGHLAESVSANATTAVGLAAYVGWLASMIFGLIGTGTTALVSRFWGAGEFAQANRVANRSIALATVLGGIVFLVVFAGAPLVPRMMNMDPETSRIVIRYLRIDGIGHIFTGVSLIGAAALRGSGDMRSPMWILGLVSVLNIIVSTTLVYGLGPVPEMGVDGIVLGTVTARVTGGLLMLAALVRGLSGLRLMRKELTFRGELVSRILRIGGPAALDGLIMWGGHFVFLKIISMLGDGDFDSPIFAAHIIGIQLEAITYLPAVAWGHAAATTIGQSLGSSNHDRAIRAGHEAVRQCCMLSLVITLVFFFGSHAIYSLMHGNAQVVAVGAPAFRMVALFQVPLAASIIYVFALRGSGDTRFPMWITIIGVIGVRIPVAYVCGVVLEGGLYGAWIGMCADMVVRALLAFSRYRQGSWSKTRV
jgi:MATE family multidrug resistance protein